MKKVGTPLTKEYLDQKLDHMMEIVARGFADHENRFNSKIETLQSDMNERFTKVDERFAKIDERLDNLHEDIGKVRRYLFNLDEHFVSNPRFESFIAKNALLA